MRRLINIQNDNNECFRWCLVRYVNPVTKNLAKIRNVDREFAMQLNSKNFKFPVNKTDYAKIEKQNKISVNVFAHENKIPYCIFT